MTDEEQECHVVHLGQVRDGKTEVGLEFSEPRPGFWRVAFPPEDWTPKKSRSPYRYALPLSRKVVLVGPP